MNIVQSLIILLVLFVAAYILGECSLRLLFEKHNYGSAAIGFALMMIIAAFVYKVVMFM